MTITEFPPQNSASCTVSKSFITRTAEKKYCKLTMQIIIIIIIITLSSFVCFSRPAHRHRWSDFATRKSQLTERHNCHGLDAVAFRGGHAASPALNSVGFPE